ncbi:MAG TPA: hypothetical protein VIC86_00955 [Acidimicrobiales bacterium]|jgi:hypothetical protein
MVDPAEPRDLDDRDAESDGGAPAGRTAARRGLFGRGGGATNNGRSRPDRSTKWAIDRLDERERRFSFAAAGLAAIVAVVIYVSETSSHKVLAKGQVSPQTTLTFGLVCGALLLITTFVGRRAPVGFVALFTFLAFGTYFVLGLPFLALAAWLLYRSWKTQRAAAADVRAARASGSNPPASRAAATSAKRSPGGPSKTKGNKGPARPEGNKRYTPKRPPPPAPKPSRRERRAAQTTD